MTESKLIHEFQTYFDSRMDKVEQKIDDKFNTFCDKCQNSATFKEKFKTLFVNVYALWAFIGTVSSILFAWALGIMKP